MADRSTNAAEITSSASAHLQSMEDSGHLADNEASREQILQTDDDATSKARIFLTCAGRDADDHLEKLLECPVCYDIILPPITCCIAGHSCCEMCRQSLRNCPVCRGDFTAVRNLFAEQLLEKCLVICKGRALGCSNILPARELAVHYKEACEYRPIHCRECDVHVVFEEYLDHMRVKDKIERQKASECSTGFEIDDMDFCRGALGKERQAVWEPTWMFCYGQNFFCSLEHNGDAWWIWVSSLTSEGCKFKGQVILWNKAKGTEISYTGAVHSIRSKPEDVLKTGECLILRDTVLKDFMYHGGIDVLVRIERIYNPPKTRRGLEVESPLAVVNRERLRNPIPLPAPESHPLIAPPEVESPMQVINGDRLRNPIPLAQSELRAFATPSRTLRSNFRDTTRIPTALSPEFRSPIGSARRQAGGAATPSSARTAEGSRSIRTGGQTRRILFDSPTPLPSRSRNPRQNIAARRMPAPLPDEEVINVEE